MHSLQHLCECIALFSSTFSFAGRVAEGKDDGAFIERGHVPDDLLREGSSNSCYTWDRKPVMCCLFHLAAFSRFSLHFQHIQNDLTFSL